MKDAEDNPQNIDNIFPLTIHEGGSLAEMQIGLCIEKSILDLESKEIFEQFVTVIMPLLEIRNHFDAAGILQLNAQQVQYFKRLELEKIKSQKPSLPL